MKHTAALLIITLSSFSHLHAPKNERTKQPPRYVFPPAYPVLTMRRDIDLEAARPREQLIQARRAHFLCCDWLLKRFF